MSFLDPVLLPVLKLPIFGAVILVSFVVSLLITIIYKYTTNQSLMKQLKDEMKAFQNQMKELRAHPEKMMSVQKQSMQTNMKYMMHSMRSTLITFVPIILIFGWMNAHVAFEPLSPNQEFPVTLSFDQGSLGDVTLISPEEINFQGEKTKKISNDEVIYLLNSQKEGEYLLEFEYSDEKHSKNVIISKNHEYAPVLQKVKDSNLKTITVGNKKLIIFNLFGWKLGWIGTYIIFSIIFSMSLRKLFKLH